MSQHTDTTRAESTVDQQSDITIATEERYHAFLIKLK